MARLGSNNPFAKPKTTTDPETPAQTSTDAHNGDMPPAYDDLNPNPPPPTNSNQESNSNSSDWQEATLESTGTYFGQVRFSHVWFLFWNLAAIALTCCVLSGCGSASSVQYSLISSNGETLANMLSAGCKGCHIENAPDYYHIGLSGSCRMTINGTQCTRQFTNSFNLAHLVMQDVSNNTADPSQSAQEYEKFASLTPTPHGTVLKLGIALGALLVTSVLIGFISMGIALTRSSGFSETMLMPLILDTVILLASLGLFTGIFVMEIGGNYGVYTAATNGLMAFIGVGAWLLVAAFICRLLSNPILLVGFIGLILFLAILPLAIVCVILAACCGGSSPPPKPSPSYRDSSYRNSSAMALSQPQRNSQMVAVAAVDETQVVVKADGSIFASVRSAYAVVTHI